MDDPDSVIRTLREHGLKVTPQRQAILRIVQDTAGHVTAESVYNHARREMPTISLKTVYETLHSLAALDQIRPLDVGTGSTLFDVTLRPHHHLVCTSCHRTEDIDFDLEPLRADQQRGFTVTSTDVIVRGLCPECLAGRDASI
jgi:Fe2+ or Zn2+ uptake regulation protein